jgi:hypothetical protein
MVLANLFYRPSRVLAACSLLALSACASNEALNNQLANTRDAVEQARIAGAEQRAPADFNLATDKLNQASAAAKSRRDEDKAMRLAQQAEVDATLAHAKTDSAQASLAASEMAKSNQLMRDVANRVRQNQ